MIPGNVDPRRPDKVQRYKPSPVSANGQGEDLTPDYMNILGHQATTANAVESHEINAGGEPQMEEPHEEGHECVSITTTNATNVIPTSPQYGVAIISNAAITETSSENNVPATEVVPDILSKPPDDIKDPQSTPSRNDRFKVVKIASLEPFKRGRWKCMDYVDEVPPQTSQPSKITQSAGNLQVGGLYMQTQSLPPQQIQQILMQGGYTNGTQFFQNVPAQMLPQTQYFYPAGTSIPQQNMQQQIVNSGGVPSSMPTQFINTSQQYFQPHMVPNSSTFTIPQNYQNIQYVPANMIQSQNSAFVPTSQSIQLPMNFQQSQTFAGQPNVGQANISQPIVNGHAYPQQNEQNANSLPTQNAKNVILNSAVQQPVVSQSQLTQQNMQNQMTMQTNSQPVSVVQSQQFQQQQTQNTNSNHPIMSVQQHNMQPVQQVVAISSQNFDQSIASNVYTNPQFATSVNSLTILENVENSSENINENVSTTEASGDNPDDPAKTNPVVNAIDNKIEQAMDLVKSHLMYTVREEVEVLKEKIAELMERIQQLETENNYLRSQIPKNHVLSMPTSSTNTPVASSSTTTSQNTVPLVTASQSTNTSNQNNITTEIQQ
ncbi:protein bunched, class 2/F/G isoform isoform X1 [Coccinella septempunctata]|uniref:protein bunched, class 2/F/G isoform isoform X1 n=1 Tax=Coccinella septempunctata TaxID=41139 RepID=UPI001D067BD2|nr:protein bunched, class 2/F/G isoform isoform X1 [Coccinella septempunctata]